MSRSAAIKSVLKRLPIITALISERDRLHSELIALKKKIRFVPPGHFYSPIPSLNEVKKDEARIFGNIPKEIPGVALNEVDQLNLLNEFVPYYREMPFQSHKVEGLRYYFENPAYSYADAIFLYCMIRSLKPKRIIEIGSGYSSLVTLDTNELFFKNSIATTFIEPYPDLLLSLLKEKDQAEIKILSSRLQDVSIKEFKSLKENDILFIDSPMSAKYSVM